MTEDEEAVAVVCALAGIRQCPTCGGVMMPYKRAGDPRDWFYCGDAGCGFCCICADGELCVPNFGGDIWPTDA